MAQLRDRAETGRGRRPRLMKFHYAWVIVVVTFLALLVAAGVRTAPSVFIKPLEAEFGWDRGSISLAVSVSLFAFGFGAPLSGSLIDRLGPRRVMLAGLACTGLGLAPLLLLNSLWQLHLFWGLITGIGTGAVTNVLGATVANRWFKTRRSLVVGIFSAASAAGQLIFLPGLVTLTSASGWRAGIAVMAVACFLFLLPVVLLMRDRPEEMKLRAVGDSGEAPSKAVATANLEDKHSTSLAKAARTRDFWLLAGSFFICGYTTNGMISTHLLPHAIEHGFSEVGTAGAIGLMGLFNIIGTIASGWLSDRFDNRKLLAAYYGFRAISIAALPFIVNMNQLLIFSVIYGLDWVATVPPTVNLTGMRFGRASLGKLYGWIFCSHMIGAGLAAYAGGFFRQMMGDYHWAFISAALMGGVAVGMSLSITSPRKMKKMAARAAAEA